MPPEAELLLKTSVYKMEAAARSKEHLAETANKKKSGLCERGTKAIKPVGYRVLTCLLVDPQVLE